MWSSNSCPKYRIPVSSGLTAVRSRPHSAASRISAMRGSTQVPRPSAGAATGAEALAQLRQPAGADAAGDGLAARLVVEVARQQRRQVHEAGRLRPTANDGARAQMRARGGQRAVGEGVSSDSAGRKPPEGPPTSTRLERARRATADARRRARAASCPVGTSTMPGRRTAPLSWTSVVPGAVRGRRSRRYALGAVGHDPGHGRERLDVVDDRRLAATGPRSVGIRRPLVGLGAPVLERAQQDGLLAQHEASRTARAPRSDSSLAGAHGVGAQVAASSAAAMAARSRSMAVLVAAR